MTAPIARQDAVAEPVAPDEPGQGTAERPTRPRGVARPLHALVRAYQWIAAGRVSTCRYVPSCSMYALEALEVHGAARGSWLALHRIGRCHPWGSHGWDPVPPRRTP